MRITTTKLAKILGISFERFRTWFKDGFIYVAEYAEGPGTKAYLDPMATLMAATFLYLTTDVGLKRQVVSDMLVLFYAIPPEELHYNSVFYFNVTAGVWTNSLDNSSINIVLPFKVVIDKYLSIYTEEFQKE